MKTTRSHNIWLAAGVAVALLLVGYTTWRFFPHEQEWQGPALSIDDHYPPLMFFERTSLLDPGLFRLLIKIRHPALGEFRHVLPKFVTVQSDAAPQPLVPFVEVWDHENVIEIRIPLVARTQREQTITCVVAPLGRTFQLRANGLPPSPVAVREISILQDTSTALVTVTNRTTATITIDSLRLNGDAVRDAPSIHLPAQSQTRIVVQGVVTHGYNTSVVLMANGAWIQAYEVATTPDFRIHEWEGVDTRAEMHFDPVGVLAQHGGLVTALPADVCNREQEYALPAGSYLADVQTLLGATGETRHRASRRADHRVNDQRRSHAFIFLNEANRPKSHYIYGQLSDYVGVAAFATRQFTTDARDVVFWLGMDRAIVEPRHLLAVSGTFVWKRLSSDRLHEQDMRRLVLASLAVGPRALLYYRAKDDTDIWGYQHDPGYERAIAAINADLVPLKPFLKAALPVAWIHRQTSQGFTQDQYGTSGFFTLWSGPDHLIVLSLGYAESAWLRLPQGITINDQATAASDMLGQRDQGYIELRTAPPGDPWMSVIRLEVDYIRDGQLMWLTW
jgi:hypothetical protein